MTKYSGRVKYSYFSVFLDFLCVNTSSNRIEKKILVH